MAARALIAALLILAGGAYARVVSEHRPAPPRAPDFSRVPLAVGPWVGEEHALGVGEAKALGADATTLRLYRGPGGAAAWVFFAYFRQQQVGSQIHSPRHCLPGTGYEIQSLAPVVLELGGRRQPAERATIDRQGNDQRMIYWFQTRSGTVTDEYALKWDLVRNSLRRRPTDAAFIRFHCMERDTLAMRDLMTRLDKPLESLLAGAGLR